MKKQKQWKQKFKLITLGLTMGLLTLVIDGGQMGPAEAGVRIRARVQTPHVTVKYQNGPHHVPMQQKRVTRPFVYRLSQHDRKIARRLARVTGYPKANLLNLRSRGMSWRQIGLRLQIPRRVVRNAVHGNAQPAFRLRTCSDRWR